MNPINTIAPPLFPQSSAAALAARTQSGSASDSANPPASNQLDPNSFITLLTTQLQAQDPLDPLSPDQMVSELTSMNTLQQLIQIRQDMDTLVSAAGGTGGSSDSNANAAAFSVPAAQDAVSSAIPGALSSSPLRQLFMKQISQ